MRFAFSLARESAGKSKAARMAMIAMTTSSSMSVKADALRAGENWSSDAKGFERSNIIWSKQT
jgi:hypothetical protein